MDRKNTTVTMSLEDYEKLKDGFDGRNMYIKMMENANQNGEAVMTEELRVAIEAIYS